MPRSHRTVTDALDLSDECAVNDRNCEWALSRHIPCRGLKMDLRREDEGSQWHKLKTLEPGENFQSFVEENGPKLLSMLLFFSL